MAEAAEATHRAGEQTRGPRFATGARTARVLRIALLGLVLVPCTAARLVDVRSARHRDFTRIVFETDEKVSYAIENRSLSSERAIELTLPAAAGETILRAVHEPAVSLQIETIEAGSRALVRVSGPVDVWTNQLGNPPRVVLDLRVAEAVAARDPESLDALDYQIVVEAEPGGAPTSPAQLSPETPPAVGAEPTAPPEPRIERPTGWARSPQVWWLLVAMAVAFLFVLWIQRFAARARRAERAVAPPDPRPRAASAPVEEPSDRRAPKAAPAKEAPGAKSAEEAIGAAPASPPTPVSPSAAEPPPVASAPAPAPPAEAPLPAAPPTRSEGTKELFELLSRMDERLAVLERELKETRADGHELHERSVAQAEELRAHRVAVAKLLRRPGRARSVAPSPRSPSSS